MAEQRFTITIPCKPYVKVYLESNCGTPVDLKCLPQLLKEFRRGLSRKSEHREASIVTTYAETVTLVIPNDMFYRFGWEMNKENITDFNKVVEYQIKFLMRNYVAVNHGLGISVAKTIGEFQEEFGFTETIWSYESIKKDFYRNVGKLHFRTVKDLRKEINEILLDSLSRAGTISFKFKRMCKTEQIWADKN